MNDNLQALTNILQATKIENHEDIARQIHSACIENYKILFAAQIVSQKIRNAHLDIAAEDPLYPQVIRYRDELYLVKFSAGPIIPDTRKSALQQYSKEVNAELRENRIEGGVVCFIPFLLNSNNVRDILKKEMHIGFVNLGYTQDSLERRFDQYNRK